MAAAWTATRPDAVRAHNVVFANAQTSRPPVPTLSSRPLLTGYAMITRFRTTLPLMAALLGALALTACDRPNVVNVPPAPAPAAIPGPAGAPGATGATGAQGSTGDSGSGTSVIIMPPASAPASN